MKPSRYPSLQIPASTPADLRAFLEGVKERLEITTGDRGDPRDRLLTVRDVEAAGMATVTVRNKFATLSGGATAKSVAALMSDSGTTGTFDGVLAPSLETLTESQVADATDFITYNNTVARLQRVPYQTLRALFLHEDSDAELTGNWQFQNEELALEISAEVPRFRFTESSSTEVLPADGNVWDWTVDDQLMALSLVSDDEDTTAVMLELARDGMDPSFLALVNGTILQIQDGTLADPGLTFDDDIDTGLYRIADNRLGVSAGGVLALDLTGARALIPTGSAAAPALAFQVDEDTGFFRQGTNSIGVAAGGAEVARINGFGAFVFGALPSYWLQETDQAADETLWRFSVNARSFQIRALNDAATLAADGLLITRGTGATPSITAIQLGNTTDNPTLLVAGTGFKTFRGQIGAADGTAGAPGYTWENDPNTGVYRVSSDVVGVATGGAERLRINSTGIRVTGTALLDAGVEAAPAFAFAAATGTGIYRTGGGSLAIAIAGVLTAAFNANGQNTTLDGTAALPGFAFISDPDTGAYRVGSNQYGISAGGNARLTASATAVSVQGVPLLLPDGITAPGLPVTSFAQLYVDTADGNLKIMYDDATVKIFAYTGHAHAISDITGLQTALDAKLDAASYTAADVLAKLLTVDGAGSGIDADLLDGSSSAAFLQLATYQTLTPTWANAHTFSVTPVVPDSSWTYAKIQNVSATSRVLGRITAGAGVIEELTGANIATIVGYTAADVLAKLLTVDGAGSGIDADLLDGNNSAAFALLSGATFTGVVIGPNGAVGAPAFAFAGANNSGMYRTGGGSLGLSVAGVLTAAFNANGQNTLLDGTVALPAVAFISDPDTGVYRVSSNVLGLTCAGTQVLSIATAQVQIITTTLRLDTTTATTVGAAGAAAALPANPLGYIAANIGGTAVKIPYYTA